MNLEIKKVSVKQKNMLYKYLQYALYDGSQYINNETNENGDFVYNWFNCYFTDNNRNAYFIYLENKIIGFVMVNENLKFNNSGKCIAEFFIMPMYRKNHYGMNVAMQIFDMYKGEWEVQPMENNPIAYNFWKTVITKYTNNNFKIKNDGVEDVFIFKSLKKTT
jgi:predicted acetyltransferase